MTLDDAILGMLDATASVSSGEVAKHLGVSRQTAYRHLVGLCANGALVRTGSGRATAYERSPEVAIPAIARDLDEEAQRSKHYQLVGKSLRRHVGDASEPRVALAWAFDYMLIEDPSDERREQHGPFGPMLETSEGQYPPPLRSVPDDSVALWDQLVRHVTHPYLKARLHDLMWERRWSERPDLHARMATDSYLDLASLASGLRVSDAFQRAGELARAVADDERRERVTTAALAEAERELSSPDPKPGIALGFIDAAQVTANGGATGRIIDLLGSALRAFDDPWIMDQIVDRLVEMNRDDSARVSELRRASIERWRAEAANATGTLRLFHLNRALEEARTYHFADVAEEIRLEIQRVEIGQDDFHSVSATVELPRDRLDRTIEMIASGDDWAECLTRVAGLGPLSGRLDRNLESVQQRSQQFPLHSVFPDHVLGPWNETVFVASTDEDKDLLELARHEAIAISIASYSVADALDRIAEFRGRPTAGEAQAFFTTPLVDHDTAERLGAGLLHFLHGRFDECVMVMLPRIEAVLRTMLREAGGPIWWEPVPNRRYGIQRPLGQVLRQLEGAMDADWHRYYLTLLINPLGPNLRNLYLHGLLSRGSREHAAALVHVAASLALMRPAQEPNEPS